MAAEESARRVPPKLEQILVEIDEALRAGRRVDVEALAARYPDIAEEIRPSASVLRMLNDLGRQDTSQSM